MQGHGLMQAIARVNRVFRDKPGGLVVDYLGLADLLKHALANYTESGGKTLNAYHNRAISTMEVIEQPSNGEEENENDGAPNGARMARIVAQSWDRVAQIWWWHRVGAGEHKCFIHSLSIDKETY